MTRARAALTLALAVCAAAAPVAAQEGAERLRVRAGEHGGFSRVAVDLAGDAAWRLELGPRSATLLLPGVAAGFDTRQIFPERRVSRIVGATGAITPEGASLTLSLACDCRVEAYPFGDDMVVIDVRDPTPRADPRAEPAAQSAPAPAAQGGEDRADAAAGPLSADGLSAPSLADRLGTAPDPVVEEARRRLLEQLERAAEQGLVQFRAPAPGAGPAVAEPAGDGGAVAADEVPAVAGPSPAARPDDAPPDDAHADDTPPDRSPPDDALAAGEAPPPSPPRDGASNLEARTAFDRRRPPPVEADVPVCPDVEALPEAWRDDAPVAIQIARGRRQLYGEFDRPRPTEAMDLAWRYTRFGFGVEARALLDATGVHGPETALLVDASHVLDGEPWPPGGVLARMDDCAGPAAALRAAGLPDGEPPGAAADPDVAGHALATLPTDVRRRVGPRMILNLLDHGAREAAAAAEAVLIRVPGPEGPVAAMARAALAASRASHAEAEAIWRDIVASEGPWAPEALVRFAEARLLRSAPMPPDMLADLAAAAVALRGSEIGDRLALAEIRARATAEGLAAAFAALDLHARRAPDRAAAHAAMARALLSAPPPDVDGALAYADVVARRFPALESGPEADAARAAVADRLIDRGLANLARAVAAPAVGRDAAATLAAARAELAMGRPATALALLEGLEGSAAEAVRARAFDASGRHAEALAQTPSGAPDRAGRALRAADWQALSTAAAEGVAGALAAHLAGRPEPPAPSPFRAALAAAEARADGAPSLAEGRAALEAARTAREALEALVADDPPPAPARPATAPDPDVSG